MQGLRYLSNLRTVLIHGGLLHGQIQAAEFSFFFFHPVFNFCYPFLQRFHGSGALGNDFRSLAPQFFLGRFCQNHHILSLLAVRTAGRTFFLPTAFIQKALITPIKNLDAIFLKYNQPLGKCVQKHFVVGYHDHGALKVIYGSEQGIAGLHIKMIGRFIQQQQIGRRNKKFAEYDPAFFPA